MTAFASTSNLWEAQLLQTTTELEKKKKKGCSIVEKTYSLSHLCKFLVCFSFASLETAFMFPAWNQRWLSLGFISLVSVPSFGCILWGKDFIRDWAAHRLIWKCGSPTEIFPKLPRLPCLLPANPATPINAFPFWSTASVDSFSISTVRYCDAAGRSTDSLLFDLWLCVFFVSI